MTAEKALLKKTALVLMMILLLGGNLLACRFPGQDAPSTTPTTATGVPIQQGNDQSTETEEGSLVNGTDGDEGLRILLSDGQSQPTVVEPVSLGSGEPLNQTEISRILARLPGWKLEPEDQVEFRLPDEVIPPPLTGETITELFPSPDEMQDPQSVYGEELAVLRFAPEGEVPIAPFVSVTFNQPMVPLDTLEGLSSAEVPVELTPAVAGSWRWLGTKTLNFQAELEEFDRLPMATEYLVTIPAGVESALGDALEESVQFRFQTPPPMMQTYYPDSSPQGLEPIFFISFDQRITPDAVLETIQVTSGGESLAVRPAREDEIAADQRVQSLVDNAQEGRWLAFKATERLEPATSINITVGPGTPSAEGPLTTKEAQSFSFRTYEPLQIVEHGCSWGDDPCRPLTPFYIRFNNPLDPEAYREDMIEIEPELPNASVNMIGNTLSIEGSSKARTTYQVTISGEIQDQFGQTLGASERLRFRVGPAEPLLFGPQDVFVTLDPASERPSLSLFALNYNKLDVQIYQVEPADWPAFKEYLQKYQRTDLFPNPPGKIVFDDNVPVEAPADVLTEVSLPLSDYLGEGSGQFVVIAKPPKNLFKPERYWEAVQVWVQVTRIGLDAFVDHSEMVVWATRLQDGMPLSDVEVFSPQGNLLGRSGADGTIRFDLPSSNLQFITARKGDDLAFLLPSTSYWGESSWSRRSLVDELRWYVFDDRGMYKPGEEVHLKGWMRRIGAGETGDVGLVGGQLSEVSYQIVGPQGNELGSGQVAINAWGGFDLQFTLPENTNLGSAWVNLNALGGTAGLSNTRYTHSFQIQEFRRPEFEVKARNETTGPYFLGDEAVMAVEAKYYAGGPLPNAEASWYVNSTPTNYQPPNWPQFTFGYWTPWWWFYEGMGPDGGSLSENFAGRTDASGNHYLRMAFESMAEPRPYSVVAEGTVFDVNRQAWAGTTDLMVHPADRYVGVRTPRYFVEQGDPIEAALIVTDLDGRADQGLMIDVQAARLDWEYQDGRWQEVEMDPQDCRVESAEEPVQCEFQTPAGGRYQITAQVTDSSGRINQTRIIRWVSGGQRPPSRDVEQEQVTIIPDQETYQPGDVAEILVEAPFKDGEGLLTLSRSGILSTETFSFSGSSHTLNIPIKNEYLPNVHVQVDVVGSAPRLDDQGEEIEGVPPRPAFASGSLNLSIPPLRRALQVDAVPEISQLAPGETTAINVRVRDHSGEPVAGTELAVVVVDEAVLALSNYQLTDPLRVFYATRPTDFYPVYGRASLQLADPASLLDQTEGAGNLPTAMPTLSADRQSMAVEEEVMMEAPAMDAAETKGMGGGAETETPGIELRLDFNPLALFAPEVRTDSSGRASVVVELPDNLTRYRIMVVAVDSEGSRFGSSEASLTARLPLMVRPSAPRFLNFGDNFEFPVVLQNQTSEDLETKVVIETGNLSLEGEKGYQVMVPAGDRIEIRFPAAADAAGTARFRVAAVSGAYADAAQGELPVYTPATTEAFATYGVVDEGAVVQPVAAPEDIFPQFGGLEINTSSTALQALTDAVIYLVSYPYECSEQIASRVLGVAALRDVLTAFEAEGLPSPEELEEAVARDIEELGVLQNSDGGFPYWRRGQTSNPFNSIHVAHALQRAEDKGFEVPEEMQTALLGYLSDIENRYPSWYSEYTRNTLSAYALYVRDLMGDSDPEKARALFRRAAFEDISISGVGWIWQVLVDDPASGEELQEIRTWVGNRVVETPGAANFTTRYTDQSYLLLSSDRKTDAVLLDALMADNPESDLIPKLVSGLLAHRERGRWSNTQENVFVLLAMDRYFNIFENQTPEFVARIWLGDTYAGEHRYQGYSTERHLTEIPMSYLLEPELDAQDLVLSKDGPGRLYYRLGLKYAPTDLQLEALEMGFVVQRSYEAVDDPGDVTQQEDGTWVIKAGARVRVKLTLVADSRRYHVALVDPLPAGLEIVNPALAVSGTVPGDPTSEEARYGWWWWTWYDHQNMRDERAEAFTTLLWDGVYEYSYVARATTPGTFVVPPAKAEEMYSPEVFGRSASDTVVVE